jgi:hypothetical protein
LLHKVEQRLECFTTSTRGQDQVGGNGGQAGPRVCGSTEVRARGCLPPGARARGRIYPYNYRTHRTPSARAGRKLRVLDYRVVYMNGAYGSTHARKPAARLPSFHGGTNSAGSGIPLLTAIEPLGSASRWPARESSLLVGSGSRPGRDRSSGLALAAQSGRLAGSPRRLARLLVAQWLSHRRRATERAPLGSR